MRVRVRVRVRVCVCVCVCVQHMCESYMVCFRIACGLNMYMHVSIYVCVHIYKCTCVWLCICVCVCVRACACVLRKGVCACIIYPNGAGFVQGFCEL